MEKYYKNLLSNEGISKKEKVPVPKPPRSINKDTKQSKKDSQYEKNEEKEDQIKENDRKSVSGGNNN